MKEIPIISIHDETRKEFLRRISKANESVKAPYIQILHRMGLA